MIEPGDNIIKESITIILAQRGGIMSYITYIPGCRRERLALGVSSHKRESPISQDQKTNFYRAVTKSSFSSRIRPRIRLLHGGGVV